MISIFHHQICLVSQPAKSSYTHASRNHLCLYGMLFSLLKC